MAEDDLNSAARQAVWRVLTESLSSLRVHIASARTAASEPSGPIRLAVSESEVLSKSVGRLVSILGEGEADHAPETESRDEPDRTSDFSFMARASGGAVALGAMLGTSELLDRLAANFDPDKATSHGGSELIDGVLLTRRETLDLRRRAGVLTEPQRRDLDALGGPLPDARHIEICDTCGLPRRRRASS